MAPNKRKRDVDSSDDEGVAPGKQILPVANLPADFDEEPTDGMQYLFTVRRDARKLPHVTRVANPYEKITVLPPPRNFNAIGKHPDLPSDEWRSVFETRFRNFRKNIAQPTINVEIPQSSTQRPMPDKKERDLWWAFLAGKPESEWNPPKQPKKQSKRRGMRAFPDEPEEEDTVVTEETWHINEEGDVELSIQINPTQSLPTPTGSPALGDRLGEASTSSAGSSSETLVPREPTPFLLKHIDERMALHLLMYFTHWLNLHLEPKNSPFPRLTQVHARWIFALLAQVEDYISADDMNLLRNLVRSCLSLLKVILQEMQSGDSSTTSSQEGAMDETSCWIIISTVVGIWGQRDLWIDAEDMLKSAATRS